MVSLVWAQAARKPLVGLEPPAVVAPVELGGRHWLRFEAVGEQWIAVAAWMQSGDSEGFAWSLD